MKLTFGVPGHDPVVKFEIATPTCLAHLTTCWNCGAQLPSRSIMQTGNTAECEDCGAEFTIEARKTWALVLVEGVPVFRAALRSAEDTQSPIVLNSAAAMCGNCSSIIAPPILRGSGYFETWCEHCGQGLQTPTVWMDQDPTSTALEIVGAPRNDDI